MTALGAVLAILVIANLITLAYVLRLRNRLFEDRWQGRLSKCDEILSTADRAERNAHEALVELARAQEQMNGHLLSMERILTDPRVHQALR